MKIYDAIKQMLTDSIELRNSDKKLIWEFYKREGSVTNNVMTYEQFIKATTPETITRARRQVQESNPELQASEHVKQSRSKRASKGHQIVFGHTLDARFK